MNLFGYNINTTNIPYFRFIILFIIIFLIVSFILFVLLSYFVLKFFKMALDDNNILFYQYSKKSQKLLDLYGDFNIKKIYLVRQPISTFITFLLNVFTFYKYNKLITESQDNFPYHCSIIFEIELPNKMKKLLSLEKNNSINLCENFFIHNFLNFKTISFKNKKYTINSILKNTQKRLGNEKFFNWHVYKNNCQEFIKEILITINKYSNSNKKYILCSNKVINFFIPSEFTVHFINCCCVIYNIFEKYIYDLVLFN
jgi:hypothetical protein